MFLPPVMLIILFIVKNFLILIISFKRKQALLRSNLSAIKLMLIR